MTFNVRLVGTHGSEVDLVEPPVVVDVAGGLLVVPVQPVVEAGDLAFLQLTDEHVLETTDDDNKALNAHQSDKG